MAHGPTAGIGPLRVRSEATTARSTRATGDASNPFDKGASNHGQWAIDTTLKKEYDNTFFMLPGSAFEDGGLVRGADCVNAMAARAGGGLGRDALFKIWGLCDPKNSGSLDDERFAVAMYLIDQESLL